MHPITFPRPAHLVLVVLLALPAAWCAAQENPAALERPLRPEIRLTSIDFPGGPFSKLVASFNKEGLSIIQSAGLDPVLPAFSVHEVRVESVIAAVGRLLEPQGYILTPVGPGLAVLTRIERNHDHFASFQLENKIVTRPVEDVIAALQQGCEFAHEGRPSTLRFKYHPGTKLLFVAGSEQDIEVAYQVYASLPNVAAPKEPTATPPPEKK